MRDRLLCCGAAGFLAIALPVAHTSREIAVEPLMLPAWLALPPGADLASITYTGSPGQEWLSGDLVVTLDETSSHAMAALKTRLALDGFMIEDRGGLVFTADNPVDGRSLRAKALTGTAQGILRVSFSEPPA